MLVTGSAAAFAATLDTEVVLSSNVNAPTTVLVGDNTFEIKVWATGNLPDNRTGEFRVTTVYNMATSGAITPDNTQFFTGYFADDYNYSQCPTTGTIPQGCAANPFVVTATLKVAAATPDGTDGTVTASMLGSQSLDPDPTPDTGYVEVEAAAVNQAPVVLTPAQDADGEEGDTLTTSGAFSDPDGDDLTVSKVSGAGAVTDNGDGTWTWSLATSDNGSGTVQVAASDGTLSVMDSFDWSAVNVAPVVSEPTVTGLTACRASVSATFSDKGTDDTHTASITWGDGTTDPDSAPATSPVTGTHTFTSTGTKSIGVSVTDDDGATGTAIGSFTTLNTPSALMQPINSAGTRSTFKLGSTIPLKITVSDCAGQQVTTLTPAVSLYKLDSNTDGTINETQVNEVPTNGKNMRWSDTLYIYNLSSKLSQFTNAPLTAGTYKVVIDDASFFAPVSATFDLKK